MRNILFTLFVFVSIGMLNAQVPTNAGTFSFLGKNYTANYSTDKHILTFTPEVSFEIYDQSGTCVKRGSGTKVDFRSLLKKGEGEVTFTVVLYKKTKKKKFLKTTSIKSKGEIGTMLVTDILE